MLVTASKPYGLSATSEPLSSMIRVVMNGWAKEVLGPKPSEAAAKSLLASLNRWTCSQPACVAARQFLTTPNSERVKSLERIGAPARKHVEKEL